MLTRKVKPIKAIILGAGPAGLTAAYELLHKTNIKPIIYEMEDNVGGLSKTIDYKGNKIDIGGHRFYSKSEEIVKWWSNILPFEEVFPGGGNRVSEDTELKREKVMLVQKRASSILFENKFFDYPLNFNHRLFSGLGIKRILNIIFSYSRTRLFPIKKVKTIEDLFINRFGKTLYELFFKDYTQKVWGVTCREIDAVWGKQRIRGMSAGKAITHAVKKCFFCVPSFRAVWQKNAEPSLSEMFMYPKLGAGQLWEEVARIIVSKGGEIWLGHKAEKVRCNGNTISSVVVRTEATNELKYIPGDYFFSTMPIKDLILGLDKKNIPEDVYSVAKHLTYRDLIVIGLLVESLKIKENNSYNKNNIFPDQWIYVQDKNISLGRIQILNNWSPYLVNDRNTIWLGLEYFCSEGDYLWSMPNKVLLNLAQGELEKIGFINKANVLDGIVVRAQKAYPIYSGGYKNFSVLRDFINNFENLYLIGRNGMHCYDSTEHAMLTAITAVKNIVYGIKSKNNLWAINN